MSLEYKVLLNALTKNVSYYAKPVAKSVYLDDLIRAINLRNPNMPASTINAIIQELINVVGEELTEGNQVTIEDLVTIFPTIKSRYNTPLPTVIPENLLFDATVSDAMTRKVRNDVKLSRIESQKKVPQVQLIGQNYLDTGRLFEAQGNNLKFNPEKQSEGVFFRNTLDMTEARAEEYAKSTNTQAITVCPDLTPAQPANNEFEVEVRTRYTPKGEIRKGQYRFLLRTTRVITTSQLGTSAADIFRCKV